MSFSVKLFWKGTCLDAPCDNMETWNALKKASKYTLDQMKPDDIEFYKNQLNNIEQKICDYQNLHPKKEGRVINQINYIKKIFKNEIHINDPLRIITIWCANIINLIEYGIIQNDNNTGYYMMRTEGWDINEFLNNSYNTQEAHRICGLCSGKASKKCPLCPQRYCCPEHQKQDWKKHKTTHN